MIAVKRVGFRNPVRGRGAASGRTSIAWAFPDSGGCRGLLVRLSGALSSGSAGRAAVQIGALEGAGDPVGFANSGGLVFIDESAEEVATAKVARRGQWGWVA